MYRHRWTLLFHEGVIDQLRKLQAAAYREQSDSQGFAGNASVKLLEAGPIGIIATSELAQHHVIVLPDWGMPTLLTQSRTHVTSPTVAQLGCSLAEGPMAAFIQGDAMQQTSMLNVFACGDEVLIRAARSRSTWAAVT